MELATDVHLIVFPIVEENTYICGTGNLCSWIHIQISIAGLHFASKRSNKCVCPKINRNEDMDKCLHSVDSISDAVLCMHQALHGTRSLATRS